MIDTVMTIYKYIISIIKSLTTVTRAILLVTTSSIIGVILAVNFAENSKIYLGPPRDTSIFQNNFFINNNISERITSDGIFNIQKNSIINHELSFEGGFESMNGFHVVDVYYATNRNRTDSNQIHTYYGNDTDKNGINLGKRLVTIPKTHKIGNIESVNYWKLQFSEDPTKHITLYKLKEMHDTEYFYELNNKIKNSENKEAIIFIHGYNTGFTDAAKRTAQLSYDLDFKGPAILFSWPSHGKTEAYPHDATNAERSIPHLEWFLEQVVKTTGASTVHLIAHSMGNRVLMNALARLAPRQPPGKDPLFREILLTAPDIDIEVFHDLAKKISTTGKRSTLYVSKNDEALRLSQKFNGYPRAGDITDDIVISDNVDTIDATSVNTDFIGHNYYAENRSVLSDFYYTLRGIPVDKRNSIRPAKWKDKSYWVFSP